MSAQTPLTFGSLFAGIGGFDLGFERAGMVCKWQVEIDPYCQKVLAKHWPSVRRHDDIKTFPPTNPKEWQVDVICGGFPCQDISYAGKGAGLAGERSGLFYEAIRVVCEVGPRIVVLENVAGLLTRGIDQVLGTLASVGFNAEWHCIPAASIGSPHIRDRVFILAHRKNTHVSQVCKKNSELRTEWPKREFRGADGMYQGDGRWLPEPDVGRVVNGVPSRVDRIRGLGNSVVPQVAEYIGRMITNAFCAETNEAAQ